MHIGTKRGIYLCLIWAYQLNDQSNLMETIICVWFGIETFKCGSGQRETIICAWFGLKLSMWIRKKGDNYVCMDWNENFQCGSGQRERVVKSCTRNGFDPQEVKWHFHYSKCRSDLIFNKILTETPFCTS